MAKTTKARKTAVTRMAVKKAAIKDLDVAKSPAGKVVGGTYSLGSRR